MVKEEIARVIASVARQFADVMKRVTAIATLRQASMFQLQR